MSFITFKPISKHKHCILAHNNVPFVAIFFQTDMNDEKLNNFKQAAVTYNTNI